MPIFKVDQISPIGKLTYMIEVSILIWVNASILNADFQGRPVIPT